MNVGTLEFMAPEMVHEKSLSPRGKVRDGNTGRAVGYDERADIWSFGMLVFEALTGCIPYRAEKVPPRRLLDHVRTGTRPRLPDVDSMCAQLRPLHDMMQRCTELNAADRPTAQALFRELMDVVHTIV
eukprot:TRINITY_DN2885_c0_g2_i1.p1 TRINITY_DN2885_c0_g2~~TRINITY_DN2885_c0_g2_i1.p1  ORF type:complete len:128 (-),score=54.22 TRINITY_DN2885_c0_g2_i1:328-711(-)